MLDTRSHTKFNQALLHKLGEVVHQIQRERGCACLFLDSDGKVFQERTQEQIKCVDTAMADLKAYYDHNDVKSALPEGYEARLAYLLRKYSKLETLREKTKNFHIRYTQALNDYTFNFTIPTIDAMIELAQREPHHNSALVTSYSNFLQWKERVGMERALGARGFYASAFRNVEFRDRFIALVGEQKTYLETFKALASPSQIELVQDVINEDNLKTLTKTNELIEAGSPPKEIETFSGETWFNLLTRMIDGMRIAEQRMVDTLEGTAPAREVSNNNPNSNTKKYRGFLRSLPILSALKDADFDDLLSMSQFREYEKGKLIFMRDEPAARMYIILNGWVKAYNGSESGEEAILQMLGAGETLLESAVFLNMPTPLNAQVVEKALILSIPAPVIRQRIAVNQQLAMNMLNTISLRSQRLVQQLELSRLKSAQERVGWFLLRLALNQRSNEDKVFLPYEKAIIASYLDMRPETFSRTLQKFKKDGFEVSSDNIKVPHDEALCKYCDIELAGQCDRAHTDACPNPELADLVSDLKT